MAIVGLIFNNFIIESLLSIFILFLIFYIIGRIVQEQYSFKKSNNFLSIPIGFCVYLFINQIIYSIIIFLNMDYQLMKIIDLFKEIILLIFIVSFYKIWMPKWSSFFNKTFFRTIFLFLFSALIPFSIYLLLWHLLENFSPINENFIFAINRIEQTGIFHEGFVQQDSLMWIFEKYESFYYWVSIISNLLFNDLYSYGSSFEYIEKTIEYIITPVILISISLMITGLIIDPERSIITVFISTFTSISSILLLGIIGPYNKSFYSLAISIFLIMMMYNYLSQSLPSNRTIIFYFFMLFIFLAIDENALILMLIYGMIAVISSFIKKGDSVRNIVRYFGIIFGILTLSVLLFLIENIEYISESIIYLILLLILFGFIYIPFRSLGHNQSRRKELVSFEEKTSKNFTLVSFSISLAIFLFSLFLCFVYEINLVNLLESYFIQINMFNDEYLIGLLIYSLIVILPMIIILILLWAKYNFKSSLFLTFFYINMLFNPINIIVISTLFKFDVDYLVTFMPSLLLLFVALLNLLTRSIPQKWRI
ncbi:MAG: hypothetical protein TYPL_0820 [Candidatus Tyloplasma litorale]|nr:MAG: hypothetical protein TYPL_0820 [Mycoplasmatales bacterium]